MALAHVYRNLNTGSWSIRQRIDGKWRVVGHAAECVLTDVTVRQSEKARQRVIERGQRDVHCWAIGTLAHVDGFKSHGGRQADIDPAGVEYVRVRECVHGITYIPTEHKTLVYRDTGREYAGSTVALFSAGQKMRVN